jgi:hypothetical protein
MDIKLVAKASKNIGEYANSEEVEKLLVGGKVD